MSCRAGFRARRTVNWVFAGPRVRPRVSRTAARTLCNSSLRTASGPEGSSAKQTLRCAAGAPGRGGAHPRQTAQTPTSQRFHTSHFNVSYQVLARKWRPQRFDDVVGQQAVTRTLRNAITSGRIAHAFVFAGLARLRQDDDGAHPGARAELREGTDAPIRAASATPASRSRRGATSTCSRSTRPATPASTTSARWSSPGCRSRRCATATRSSSSTRSTSSRRPRSTRCSSRSRSRRRTSSS